MEALKPDDFVKARQFKVFVFNDRGLIMMVRTKSRFDIPFGQIEQDDIDFEAAVRRIVLAETKTALNPIVPVMLINVRSPNGEETPTLILAARMDGEAKIKEDEKTHHRLMDEKKFLMQAGYQNQAIRTLLEEAKHALFREEVRMEHEEATQYGKEKYNYRSRL